MLTAFVLAAPVIDQEQYTVDLSVGAAAVTDTSPRQLVAQTFTPGRSGLLTHVTLPIECQPSATLLVRIEKTSGGVPNGGVLQQEVLAGTVFPAGSISPPPSLRVVDFSGPSLVAAGETYAIVLEAFGDFCSWSGGPAADSYGGGAALTYSDWIGAWMPWTLSADMPFQTFVE
jgi:hypothetical protein